MEMSFFFFIQILNQTHVLIKIKMCSAGIGTNRRLRPDPCMYEYINLRDSIPQSWIPPHRFQKFYTR